MAINVAVIECHLFDLAESWDVQEDGKVYIFHLRKGVKFHDGTDLTAEVVKWNFDRLFNAEEQVITARYFEPIVESVTVVDPHTLKITLKYPTNTLIPALAIYRVGFMIISPESYKKWGKNELFERWRRTVDPTPQNQIGWELQEYIAQQMIMPVVTTRPTLQAAREAVEGYPYLRGMKVNFETTWLAP